MNQWDEMCIDYRNNEENIEVVDETQFKIELEPSKNLDSLATSSGGVGAFTTAIFDKSTFFVLTVIFEITYASS